MQEVEKRTMLHSAPLRILAAFFPAVRELRTTAELQQRAGYSHERTHTVLQQLHHAGLVELRKFGKVNTYRLALAGARPAAPEHFLAYVAANLERKKAVRADHAALAERLTGLEGVRAAVWDHAKKSILVIADAAAADAVTLLAKGQRGLLKVLRAEELLLRAADAKALEALTVLAGLEWFYAAVYQQAKEAP